MSIQGFVKLTKKENNIMLSIMLRTLFTTRSGIMFIIFATIILSTGSAPHIGVAVTLILFFIVAICILNFVINFFYRIFN